VTPSSLNLNHRWSGQLHAPAALLPGELPAVLTEWDAVWAPEPFWTEWRRDKTLTLAVSSHDSSVVPLLGLPCSWELHCTVLRYYAASNGNFLPKFWDSLSVPSSRVQLELAYLSKTVRTCRFVRRLCHKTGIFISTAVRTSNLDMNKLQVTRVFI
jgi:hypothetical protein